MHRRVNILDVNISAVDLEKACEETDALRHTAVFVRFLTPTLCVGRYLASLFNEVFDSHESGLEAVRAIALEIASKSPLAVTSSKEIMRYARDHSVDDALQYQQLWMGAVNQGKDMGTYFQAKADGGEPEYEDLAPLAKA